MKAIIGETDSSAVKGVIFWRTEEHVSIDDEKALIYIYTTPEHHKLKEIVNMASSNFHCVKFEEL